MTGYHCSGADVDGIVGQSMVSEGDWNFLVWVLRNLAQVGRCHQVLFQSLESKHNPYYSCLGLGLDILRPH